MLRLLSWSLHKTVVAHKWLTLFIVCNIAAALFCVNVLLGYAETRYYETINSNEYGTITIVPLNKSVTVDEYEHILNQLDYSSKNTLYIKSEGEYRFLIGWNGVKHTNWFPHVSGRFFMEDELNGSEHLAYVGWSEMETLLAANQSTIEIGGASYRVIGCGWMPVFNFKHVISESSSQTVFKEAETQHNIGDNPSYADPIVHIIPYGQFGQKFDPDLIMTQFDSITNRQLEDAREQLNSFLPDCEITVTTENSDTPHTSQVASNGRLGTLFGVILLISMVIVVGEWMYANQRNYQVHLICGASKRQMIVLIMIQISILFVAGEGVALLAQYLLRSQLVLLGVEFFAPPIQIIIVWLIAISLTCLVLPWRIYGLLKFEGRNNE